MKLNDLYRQIESVAVAQKAVEKASFATLKDAALRMAKEQNKALAKCCELIAMQQDEIAALKGTQ